MKGPVIDKLVFSHMFPKPKATDPQNFQGLLQRQLIQEVRHETQAFYGHLASQEAKYPGLDYSFQPHRNRLSRYPWHRRLFRAFDALGLTESEIAGLTKWEGTRWAKERFEKEQGVVIRDTTGDGIEDWVEPELRVPGTKQPAAKRIDAAEIDGTTVDGPVLDGVGDRDGDDSDMEMHSVGIALNARLRAAVAAREAGNTAVLDEEWEQWLKDAAEAGNMPVPLSGLLRRVHGSSSTSSYPALEVLPQLLNAARLGDWHSIPDFLHAAIRRNIDASRHPRGIFPPPSRNPNPSSNSNLNSLSVPSLETQPDGPVSRQTQFRESLGSPLDHRIVARLQYNSPSVLPPLPLARAIVDRVARASQGESSL